MFKTNKDIKLVELTEKPTAEITYIFFFLRPILYNKHLYHKVTK